LEADQEGFGRRTGRYPAAAFGVVVEFYTHPEETHRMVGVKPKMERTRELKHFIFEE